MIHPHLSTPSVGGRLFGHENDFEGLWVLSTGCRSCCWQEQTRSPQLLMGHRRFDLAIGDDHVFATHGDLSLEFRDRKKHVAYDFLAEIWDRNLFQDHEARVLYRALSQELREAAATRWLMSCALNLSMGRSEMLEERITSRLRGKYFFHLVERSDLGFMKLFAKESTLYYRSGRDAAAPVSVPADGSTYRAALGRSARSPLSIMPGTAAVHDVILEICVEEYG